MKDVGQRTAEAAALKHAVPYIRIFKGKTFVIKAGGGALERERKFTRDASHESSADNVPSSCTRSAVTSSVSGSSGSTRIRYSDSNVVLDPGTQTRTVCEVPRPRVTTTHRSSNVTSRLDT